MQTAYSDTQRTFSIEEKIQDKAYDQNEEWQLAYPNKFYYNKNFDVEWDQVTPAGMIDQHGWLRSKPNDSWIHLAVRAEEGIVDGKYQARFAAQVAAHPQYSNDIINAESCQVWY